MSSSIKIGIIGAGPAGLTLANILQHNNIPCTIYDLDASPEARNRGGSLDLHPRHGQLALREAGLWDEFVKHARPESDVMKIVQQDGEVLWDGNGADACVVSEANKFDHRPEIDRGALMSILLGGVDAQSVKWGKKLREVMPAPNEQYDLHFADGSTESAFDLVVGADGAWSKVRRWLSDTTPHYSGITAIELWALNVKENHPWMSSYVGKGSCFSFGEDRAIQIQVQGDGSIRTYASLRKPETFLHDCGIDWNDTAKARKEFVQQYFGDCGQDLKRMLFESDDELVPRPLHMLPVGFRWDTRPGVTLLGDAAHLMTPFAGVGVNAAMADALELARGLIKYTKAKGAGSLAGTLKTYEDELFPRGEMFAQKTVNNMEKHFSADGNIHMADRLRTAFGPAKTLAAPQWSPA
ncbi:hypothetical protein BT93_L5524 [Corymbia citriodora subsp. variegata]|uniref:FAD-binding domain-containing protein n=1 Tax=Corymbia citriodora subsp. variegata TaxID=360336 RepID=A0A8T0CF06_CORYI|nr:hypothetical protein BT93_L5524 [Corymbia citriodora subsp. variegata]